MHAGKLDRIITIERATETVTPSGGVVIAWAHVATLRAELVEQQAFTKDATAYGEAFSAEFVFRTRFISLTTADRLKFEGRAFNLKSVVEIGRRRGVELRAVGVP